MTVAQILTNNPDMAPNNGAKVEPRKSGNMSIRGPVDFTFSYGDRSLYFSKAKAVLYPISNYKIKFIHLFPQADYASHSKVFSELEEISRKMISHQWTEDYHLKADKILTELTTRNQRDVASYRFRGNGKSDDEIQMVVTVFKDAVVKCTSVRLCENQYLRLAFY